MTLWYQHWKAVLHYWANRAKVPEEKRVAEWGHEQIARGGELHIRVVEPFDQNGTEWYVLTKEKFLEGIREIFKRTRDSELIPRPFGTRAGIDTSHDRCSSGQINHPVRIIRGDCLWVTRQRTNEYF